MPKSVSIYERKGVVYVSASHQTQAGFWVGDSNVVALIDPQAADVGSAVEAALARSRENVPTPPTSADLSGPLLAAAGVASWNTFARMAKHVDVYQKGDVFEITPYRNLGGKEGFEPISSKATLLPSGSPGLAAAVARAIEMAE